MRAIFIAAAMALGIGLSGVTASVAAPASGHAIAHAAKSGHAVHKAHWRRHHHHRRHCWRFHGHLRCW
jgi:hypothetical protein